MESFNRVGYLQSLMNKYGDFKVAYSFKTPSGDVVWSKHRSVLECWSSEEGLKFLEKVNHRQILPNEIILDIEKNISIHELDIICNIMESWGTKCIVFSTGSRGYHIHIKVPKLQNTTREDREFIKKYVISRCNCDMMKVYDSSMIALENVPHWKTGNIKSEIKI